MAASGSAAKQRPRGGRRSIRFTLTAMVTWSACALIVLWAAAMGSLLATGQARRSFLHGHRDLAAGILIGAGLAIIVVAVAIMRSFAGRLAGDIRGLAETAGQLAAERSPQSNGAPGRQAGGELPDAAEDTARPRAGTPEIARAQAAIVALRQAGTAAAAGDASLREGLRQVFISLARRNQSLLQRQLRLIDALEQKAADPAALADLFALDHLTTRMRRQAESLAVLSGAAPGRSFRDPIPVVDVIRGAMAEIEDYPRVVTPTVADDTVIGPAAADMMHLLAELIENAALCSPSGTQVEVRAGLVAHGLAVEIDDRGLGIEPGRLDELNQMLASPPDFDLADADRLGLFVAGKLAARHGARVSLRSSPYGGTTAIVLMPASIIVPAGGRNAVSRGSAGRDSAGRDSASGDSTGWDSAGRDPADWDRGSTGAGIRPELAGPAAVSQRAARRLAVAGRLSASAAPWYTAQPKEPAEQPPATGPAPGGLPADHPTAASPTAAALPGALPPAAEHTTAVPPAAAPPAAAPPAAVPEAAEHTTAGSAAVAPAAPVTAPGSPATPDLTAEPPTAAGGAPAGGTAAGGTAAGGTASGRLSVERAVAGAGPAADTYRGLPRRSRQASLSPHLRDSDPAGSRPEASAEPASAFSPEQARSLAAAWQSGWQRERQAESPDGVQPADEAAPGQPDPDLPTPDRPVPDLPPGEMSPGERE